MNTPYDATDTIHDPQRTKEGKLSFHSRAQAALKGMPPCPLAEDMGLYELQFLNWRYKSPSGEPKWWPGVVMRLARPVVEIFRAEITALALAYSKLVGDTKAEDSRKDFYKDYLRITEEQRKFTMFLESYFKDDLRRAQVSKVSTLELATALLLELHDKRGTR
jgi:hypothetical protein